MNGYAEGVSKGPLLAVGIILIIAGCAALVLPLVATLTIELIIGCVLLVGGIMQIIYAFSSRAWGRFSLRLLAGILYLIVGFMLVVHPLRGAIALTLLLGILFVVEGLCKIVGSLMNRAMPNWGWLFFSGVLALLIGIIIWGGWPGSAAWALGLLVGINVLFRGWALTALALSLPRKS
jgi:uncharacterized membrane protein HdeD (DUF308 family)